MAARGTIAKSYIENKIIDTFGADFMGILDKKIYINVDDGGEMVPIAITLTCPKVSPFEGTNMSGGAYGGASASADISEEEIKNIHDLMVSLDLLQEAT